jgi:hypothetical protein
MTQSRKLKKTIRARARKTGESYTAARRMVLKRRSLATAVPAELLKREARLVEKTGHGWRHWFAVLDRFGAEEKGHTAAARHLSEDHGVNGWHAQEITVSYERARGLRSANQRMSGEYEVSVSKVLKAPVAVVAKLLRDPKLRWTSALDAELRAGYEAALAGPRGLRARGKGSATLRFKAASGVTVALYLDPRPEGKTQLVAQNMKLGAAGDVERLRADWKKALAALGQHFEG